MSSSPLAKRLKLAEVKAISLVPGVPYVFEGPGSSSLETGNEIPEKPEPKRKTPAKKTPAANKTTAAKKAPAVKKATAAKANAPSTSNEAEESQAPKGKAKAPKAPKAPAGRQHETLMDRVNRLLRLAGYKAPTRASKCGRAGLIRGHYGFKFTGEPAQLDIIAFQDKCLCCSSGTVKATVRQLLDQKDLGDDYEDGSEGATATCDSCEEGRFYVTRCCTKDMSLDCGKFHNHCGKCPVLGKCVGDYRSCHCKRCGKHYWGGGDGRCSCSSRGRRNDCVLM